MALSLGVRSPAGMAADLRIAAAFAAIYLIWGSTYLAIKFAVETLPPLVMVSARSLTAGLVLYGWSWWKGAAGPTVGEWLMALLIGSLMFVGGHGSLAWAQQRVDSGIAALFIATIPIWMTMLQGFTGPRGGISARTSIGVVVGTAGIVLLVGPREILGGEPVEPLVAMALVGAAVSWSVGSRVSQFMPRPDSVAQVTGMYLLGGGLLLLAGSAVTGQLAEVSWQSVSTQSVVALAYLIIFGSVVALFSYTWLLQRATLSAISTYAFVNPVIALFLGAVFGDEVLSPRVLAAAFLVVAAVVLILSQRR